MESFDQFIYKKQTEVASEKEKLEQAEGVAFQTEPDPETGEEKRYVNFFGTKIETQLQNEEEFRRVKESINFSELDEIVFSRIAQAYDLKHSLMLEGSPGAGKTYDFSKFHELISGDGKEPLILTCTPKMSELEIIGHWMPSPGGRASADSFVKEAYSRFDAVKMEYDAALAEYEQMTVEAKRQFAEGALDEASYHASLESAGRLFEPIQAKFNKESVSLRAETEGQVDWVFRKGALLEAYVGDGGAGRMLVVDEFNLLPSNVQQIFLRTISTGGRLADSIADLSNSQTEYARGANTYIGFAQNFPEKTRGRNIVAAPMTDRVEWLTIPQELVDEKEDSFIKSWGGKRLARKTGADEQKTKEKVRAYERSPALISEACGGAVAGVLGEALDRFHREYKALLKQTPDQIGDEERTQDLENSARRALHTMNHIERFLIRGGDGKIDLEKTFVEAVVKNYADRIFDSDLRQKAVDLLNKLVADEVLGKTDFEGETVTVRGALAILRDRLAREEYERQASRMPEGEKEESARAAENEKFAEDKLKFEIYRYKLMKEEIPETEKELDEFCALEENAK